MSSKTSVDISSLSTSSHVHWRMSACCSWQTTKPSSTRESLFVSTVYLRPPAFLPPGVCWLLRGGWLTDLQDQLLLTETSCWTTQDHGGWMGCWENISVPLFHGCLLKDSQERQNGSLHKSVRGKITLNKMDVLTYFNTPIKPNKSCPQSKYNLNFTLLGVGVDSFMVWLFLKWSTPTTAVLRRFLFSTLINTTVRQVGVIKAVHKNNLKMISREVLIQASLLLLVYQLTVYVTPTLEFHVCSDTQREHTHTHTWRYYICFCFNTEAIFESIPVEWCRRTNPSSACVWTPYLELRGVNCTCLPISL